MPSVGATVAIGVAACAISVVATPLMARLATRLRWTDRPGPLKPQSSATPYLGGLAVAFGVALGVGIDRPLLFVPILMALIIGTIDDVRPLSPLARLIAEVITAGVVAAVITTRFPTGLSFLLVIVSTIVLVNGFNLIDGMDALCGSVTLVCAIGFAIVLTDDGRFIAVALAGAIAGFLVFNRPPARIYLGDGGSYLIGTCVAILLALCWGPTQRVPIGLASLLLVALPAAELALAVIRRVRAGTSLLTGDRDHPYDQLVRRGWNQRTVVLSYGSTALVLAAAAVIASRRGTSFALVVVAVCGFLLLVVGIQQGFMSPGYQQRDERQG
jgi:UDP-GlcNAc:undecaprenyl-phosphate/decaprenyl-phosphate GlcNAc-1-phosphate transferase